MLGEDSSACEPRATETWQVVRPPSPPALLPPLFAPSSPSPPSFRALILRLSALCLVAQVVGSIVLGAAFFAYVPQQLAIALRKSHVGVSFGVRAPVRPTHPTRAPPTRPTHPRAHRANRGMGWVGAGVDVRGARVHVRDAERGRDRVARERLRERARRQR